MKLRLLIVFLISFFTAVLAAQDKFEFIIKTDRADGIYAKGETVRYSVSLLKNGKPANGVEYTCQFSVNGYWKDKQSFIYNGTPLILTKKFEGTTLWHSIKAEIPGTKVKSELGAIASPYDIKTAVGEPADFDKFWQKQRAELAKVPVEVIEKTEVPLREKFAKYRKDVVCYDVKVKCSGSRPVSGYLCMPRNAKAKSLPVVVTFQGSGVVSAGQEPEIGSKAIVFGFNTHGTENGKPYQYYREQLIPGTDKKLDAYLHYGVWNKERYYFKGIYIRGLRALEYVKTLPEWDGKNLIVSGASQGGAMSMVMAAMDKDVTFCDAGVPALCDQSAVYADRLPGGPKVVTAEKSTLNTEKKWFMMVLSYYDVSFFAKRIKCEINVSAGLLDFSCSPTSVMSAYNNIPAGVKKSIQIVPDGFHGTASHGMEKRFNEVLDAAVRSNK